MIKLHHSHSLSLLMAGFALFFPGIIIVDIEPSQTWTKVLGLALIIFAGALFGLSAKMNLTGKKSS